MTSTPLTPATAPAAPCAAVRLLGADLELDCADGRRRRFVDLDLAASAGCLPEVWAAVEAFVPWSAGVHRGTGAKSRVATDAYEAARADVAAFVGARPDDHVVRRSRRPTGGSTWPARASTCSRSRGTSTPRRSARTPWWAICVG